MCHQADTAPAFLFSEQKKQVEEVLRVDPKNLNSYVGVVNQPPPKWSSVKKWLLHINYAPGYAPEPEQKPVCRQFSRCEGCPYQKQESPLESLCTPAFDKIQGLESCRC